MKTKIVKLRNRATGIAHYEEVIDVAGIVAVARALASADRPNSRAAAVVAWADSLDHVPTSVEFMEWYTAHGGTFGNIEIEEYAN